MTWTDLFGEVEDEKPHEYAHNCIIKQLTLLQNIPNSIMIKLLTF